MRVAGEVRVSETTRNGFQEAMWKKKELFTVFIRPCLGPPLDPASRKQTVDL